MDAVSANMLLYNKNIIRGFYVDSQSMKSIKTINIFGELGLKIYSMQNRSDCGTSKQGFVDFYFVYVLSELSVFHDELRKQLNSS